MKFIPIIAFCFLFNFSYSQEKSLYERKKEQIDIEYSINYIQKVFFLAKTFDIIYFSISKSLPLKLSFHLDYDSSKLEFYIAPKIED